MLKKENFIDKMKNFISNVWKFIEEAQTARAQQQINFWHKNRSWE